MPRSYILSAEIVKERGKHFAQCWACRWRSQRYSNDKNAKYVLGLHNEREH